MVKFKLLDIVKQYMSEIEVESTHKIERYLQFGIDAIRELHMDVSGAPTWKVIEIDQNTMTVTLPDDCLRLLAVGELTPKNNLKTLILDNNMVLNDSSSNGFHSYVFSDETHYGAPAIHDSSYRQDYRTGTLKVSSDINSKCLYVEYLADIERINGQYMIPPYEKQAVLSYIRWADVRSSIEAPENKVYRFERYWTRDKMMAESRTGSMTLDEWLETHYKGLTGTLLM